MTSVLTPVSVYCNADVENTGVAAYTPAQFPNTELNVVKILNPYKRMASNDPALSDGVFKSNADGFFGTWQTGEGDPHGEICYSLYGYIYFNPQEGNTYINENGTYVQCPEPTSAPTVESLPVLRYIMPIPRTVIARSYGAYSNQYGYR